ncbi:MAG: hypothetical protein ACFCBW_15260 [Candidatus Competibacterales bacterium]
MSDGGLLALLLGLALFHQKPFGVLAVLAVEALVGGLWLGLWRLGTEGALAYLVCCGATAGQAAAFAHRLPPLLAVAAWGAVGLGHRLLWAGGLVPGRRFGPSPLRLAAALVFWETAILGALALDRPGGPEAAVVTLVLVLVWSGWPLGPSRKPQRPADV